MSALLFAKGLIVGGVIAAPVGPIGVLCLHRALAGRAAFGLASGLGAATADAIYGGIAAFGLTTISDLLIDHQDWLRLSGGLLLVWFGVVTWRRPVVDDDDDGTETLTIAGSFGSALLLTLSNPVTVLAFAIAFGSLGLIESVGSRGWLAPSVVVLGVFIGAATWWIGITAIAHGIGRGRVGPAALGWINRSAGLLLVVFGVVALAAAADSFLELTGVVDGAAPRS